MAAFNFQPQHIVANPYTFFYKADTTEHREKLRIIFPTSCMGFHRRDNARRQLELKDAEREYDKIRRELDARTKAARAWEAEVESYYLQAKGLGLLARFSLASARTGAGLDKYLLELNRVPPLGAPGENGFAGGKRRYERSRECGVRPHSVRRRSTRPRDRVTQASAG